jgi:quinol monooxygenase YgiN
MTVIVTAKLGHRHPSDDHRARFGDPRNLVAFMKEHGCLHHHLFDLDGDWWLIEEWETRECFEQFFDETPEFRRALRDAGFREFPDELRLWRAIEGNDELDSALRPPDGLGGAT